MKKLLLGTRNEDKRHELSQFLGSDTQLHHPAEFSEDDVEETGKTLWENALLKARAGFDSSGLPTLADDTGLEVDALDGRPGVYSSRYAGENVTYEQNVTKLLDELHGVPDKNRTARFKTVMAYVDADRIERFEGILEGIILESRRGDNGFGYDPVFLPINHDQTLAEMDTAAKNEISHRGLAVKAFAKWWNEQ